MALPSPIEDYIKESIDHSLGIPVSAQTLSLKLCQSEEAQRKLQNQCSYLEAKLKEKDCLLELARGEATMNAQALKKFVEENQKLAEECTNMLADCNKWEKECSLYEKDREALMESGNEAHERANMAEARVQDLEEEVQQLKDELLFYKQKLDNYKDNTNNANKIMEEDKSIASILEMLATNDGMMLTTNDGISYARSFLEAHSDNEPCQALIKLWSSLKPTTRKVLSLVGYVDTLEKDKENLRINLDNAEEEVKILAEENKRLRRLSRKIVSSCGKSAGTTSVKSNKRKSSPRTSSPVVEKRLNFDDMDSTRAPFSPLECNRVESQIVKRMSE